MITAKADSHEWSGGYLSKALHGTNTLDASVAKTPLIPTWRPTRPFVPMSGLVHRIQNGAAFVCRRVLTAQGHEHVFTVIR